MYKVTATGTKIISNPKYKNGNPCLETGIPVSEVIEGIVEVYRLGEGEYEKFPRVSWAETEACVEYTLDLLGQGVMGV